MKSLYKLILNLFLVVLAITLLYFLFFPAFIVTLFIAFYKRNLKNGFLNLAQYFRQVATSIDQLGNVVCKDLFEVTLIKKEGYKFGNPDETISSVLGKNQIKGTLTIVGKVLNYLLHLIEKDHSLIAAKKKENPNHIDYGTN